MIEEELLESALNDTKYKSLQNKLQTVQKQNSLVKHDLAHLIEQNDNKSMEYLLSISFIQMQEVYGPQLGTKKYHRYNLKVILLCMALAANGIAPSSIPFTITAILSTYTKISDEQLNKLKIPCRQTIKVWIKIFLPEINEIIICYNIKKKKNIRKDNH